MERINHNDWDVAKTAASTPPLGSIPPHGAIIRQQIQADGRLFTTWALPDKSHKNAPCPLCGFRGLVELTDNNGYEFSYACGCGHGDRWFGATRSLTKPQFEMLKQLRCGDPPPSEVDDDEMPF